VVSEGSAWAHLVVGALLRKQRVQRGATALLTIRARRREHARILLAYGALDLAVRFITTHFSGR
jgi:hypothetical protein